MAISVIMITMSITYLSNALQSGFVGLWFVIAILAGWQTVRAGASVAPTDEQRQIAYKEQLSAIKNNRKKRRRG
jgi:hypothetical protein